MLSRHGGVSPSRGSVGFEPPLADASHELTQVPEGLIKIVIPLHELPELMESLKLGGGLVASYDVGEFPEGYVILAGGDLDMAAFDVYGLQDGDRIDRPLKWVLRDAMQALADGEKDALLFAMPFHLQDSSDDKTVLPFCCRRKKKKAYTWNKSWSGGIFTTFAKLECSFGRLIYASGNLGRAHDVFISFGEKDRDLAAWMKLFCKSMSMTAACSSACDALQSEKEENVDEEGHELFTQARKSGIPCLARLANRQHQIYGATIVIVILASDNALFNPWLLLDCAWAASAGVHILPIRRACEDYDIASLEAQFPILFYSQLGLGSAGLGSSRPHLSRILSRAFVKGLRTKRVSAEKLNSMGPCFPESQPPPNGFITLAKHFCRLLQHDIELHRIAAEREANAITPITAAHDQVDSVASETCSRASRVPLAELDRRERIFGAIALAAVSGSRFLELTSDVVDVMYQLSRSDVGSRCFAEFGGIEVLADVTEMLTKRRKDGQILGDALESDSRILKRSIGAAFPWCPWRGHNLGEYDLQEHELTSQSLQSGQTLRQAASSASMKKEQTGSWRVDLQSPKRRTWSAWVKEFGAVGGSKHSAAWCGDPTNVRSAWANLRLAELCFAALKNFACHSEERKLIVVQSGVARIALIAMRVFHLKTESIVRDQLACLLRNLTRGGSMYANAMPCKEMVLLAEEELLYGPCVEGERAASDAMAAEEHTVVNALRTSPDVQRHLFAMLQNMFAQDDVVDVMATTTRPQASDDSRSCAGFAVDNNQSVAWHWLEICAVCMERAWNAKRHLVLQQIASCVGNLALVRYKEIARKETMGIATKNFAQEEGGSRGPAEFDVQKPMALPCLASDEADRHESEADSSAVDPWGFDSAELAATSERNTSSSLSSFASSLSDAGIKHRRRAFSSASQSRSGFGSSPPSVASSRARESGPDESDRPSLIRSDGEARVAEQSVSPDTIEITSCEKIPLVTLATMRYILANTANGARARKGRFHVFTLASVIRALSNFAQDTIVETYLGRLGFASMALEAVRCYSDSLEVQFQSVRFLWNMTYSVENQKRFVELGGIPVILKLLSSHLADEARASLREQCCGVLRNLSAFDQNKRSLLSLGCIPILVRVLGNGSEHHGTTRNVVATLLALTMDAPPVMEALVEANGVASIVHALAANTGGVLAFELLSLLESTLIIPSAQISLDASAGHTLLLRFLRETDELSVVIGACWTIASALSIPPDPTRRGEQQMEHVELDIDSDLNISDGEDDQLEKRRLHSKQVTRHKLFAHRVEMRKYLIEADILDVIVGLLERCPSLAASEAFAAVTLNLVIDEEDILRPGHKIIPLSAKTIANSLLDLVITHLDNNSLENLSFFACTTLNMLSSLTLDADSVVAFVQMDVPLKVVSVLEKYSTNESVDVQAAACELVANLVASEKLRVRHACRMAGLISKISSLLQSLFEGKQKLRTRALRALHNLTVGSMEFGLVSEANLIHRVIDVISEHKGALSISTYGLGVLRNVSVMDEAALVLCNYGIVEVCLDVIEQHTTSDPVVTQAFGLLRNLVASSCGLMAVLRILATPPSNEELRLMGHGGGFRVLFHYLRVAADKRAPCEQLMCLCANISSKGSQGFDEFVDCFVTAEYYFQLALEKHSDSSVIQYQGLKTILHILTRRRELARLFLVLRPHLRQMLDVHKRTPATAVCESVLEMLK